MKLTKQTLKRIIKEEVKKELEQDQDQANVYLKFRMGRNMADLPTGRDYYVEVPKRFIFFKSSTEASLSSGPRVKRTHGQNGLTEEGVNHFKDGEYKGLASSISWTAVSEDDLPKIVELTERRAGFSRGVGDEKDVGWAIHTMALGGAVVVPWAAAEKESGYSKEELISYIDNAASDSEQYYMKYNDDGLDLDDPSSV